MATTDPGAVSTLFQEVDDFLAGQGALFLEGEDANEPATSYGRSLSFDWANMRFRTNASGQLVIVEGQAALLEDVVKMLLTARNVVPIYGSDYGCELLDLVGLPQSIALVQIEQMVKDALLIDNRIQEVQVSVTPIAGDSALVEIVVRDFNGLTLDVPEVTVRYG